MPIKRDVTLRQLEAQKLYYRVFGLYSAPVLLPILLFCIFSEFAIITNSKFAHLISLRSLVALVFVGIVAALFANKKAIGAVRRAGLWDEARETVARTATNFTGENLAFVEPNRRWSNFGMALFLFGVAALMGWFAIFFAAQIFDRIVAALGFASFFGAAILMMAAQNRPNVALDERGVFGHYRNCWPRLVRWHEIERAQFCCWNNFNDGADVYTITLVNAAGKTL